MLRRIEQLEKRLAALEGTHEQTAPAQPSTAAPPATPQPTAPQAAAIAQELKPAEQPHNEREFLNGTTINLLLDGYYGYNFNDPIGRVNLLRAYDVSSNAFSLNQAGLVLENAPDPSKGKPFGARFDFQYGQATETLQGNAANEPGRTSIAPSSRPTANTSDTASQWIWESSPVPWASKATTRRIK